MRTKTCTKCGEEKPATTEFFYAATRGKHGVMAHCKECVKAKSNAWYKANPGAVQRRTQEWQKQNPDKTREYKRKWREQNIEQHRATNMRWVEEHREQHRDNARRWHKDNPEKARRAFHRRRVRLSAKAESYTEIQVLEMYGTDCTICGEPIDFTAPRRIGKPGWERGLHIDHVLSVADGGPDTLDNVRPTHGLCNLKKG